MYYIIVSTIIFFVIGYYLQKYIFRGETNLTNLPELWLFGIASLHFTHIFLKYPFLSIIIITNIVTYRDRFHTIYYFYHK